MAEKIALLAGCGIGVFLFMFFLSGCIESENTGGTASFTISSLSAGSLAPLSLLKISGAGFDDSTTLFVKFYNSGGYNVEVPALEESPTAVTVAVPVFFDAAGIASGAVKVKVIEKSSVGIPITVESNEVDFEINSLPASTAAPGTVTLNYVQATADFTWEMKNEIRGTDLDTAQMRQSLDNQAAQLDVLANKIMALMDDSTKEFSLGKLKGASLRITTNELRNTDRAILGMLNAQAGSFAMASAAKGRSIVMFDGGGCQHRKPEALLTQLAAKTRIHMRIWDTITHQ